MKHAYFLVCILAALCGLGAPGIQAQTLTHGPVVGAVTTSSAAFVYRVSAAADLQMELSTDPLFMNPIYSTTFHTVADSDFFGKMAVGGLAANTLYFYRPLINGVPVADGVDRTFRTFPSANQNADFVFLLGSGQQAPSEDPNSRIGLLFNEMATVPNALFLLHQGDWCYPDTTDEEMGNPDNYWSLHYDLIQSSYRARYTPDFPMINLLRRMSVAYTYDDHDMVNDNSNHFDYPWAATRNAIRGEEYLFPAYTLNNPEGGVWHSFRVGDAEVFMTDNRAERSPNLVGYSYYVVGAETTWTFNPPATKKMLNADPAVTPDQMAWLLDGLLNSTATWKFVSTGTMWNPGVRAAIDLPLLLQHSTYDPIYIPEAGRVMPMHEVSKEFADKWAGFPESVRELIQFVADHHIENVIFLSGDSHNSAIDDGANSIFPEMMSSGLDRTNSGEVAMFQQFGVNIWNKGGHTINLPPEAFTNSYGKITVFGSDSVKLEAINQGGAVIGQHTVTAGFLPDRVNLLAAPYGLDFGRVPLACEPGVQAFVAISTSCDTLRVQNIVSSDPHFMVYPGNESFNVASGQSHLVPVLYFPSAIGEQNQGALLVFSNDPQSPQLVYVTGTGNNPQGTCAAPIVLPPTYNYTRTDTTCFKCNTVPSVYAEGCSGATRTSGPDLVYRFTTEAPGTLQITAQSGNPFDQVQIAVYSNCLDAAGSCEGSVASASNVAQLNSLSLSAGTHFLSVSLSGGDCGVVALSITSDVPLPVEFGTLEAIPGNEQVTLRWNTHSERDADRFEVLRGEQLIGQVSAIGNSSTEHQYTWTEAGLSNGTTYKYALELVDVHGQRARLGTVSGAPREGVGEITEFALYQNYPNPFNPATEIRFDLPEAAQVELSIYNALGQYVTTLVNAKRAAGSYTVHWDARDLANGLYLCQIKAGIYTATRKMLLMK